MEDDLQFFEIEDNLNFIFKMEDNLNYFEHGRRPQFYLKKDDLIVFENGRRPKIFSKRKTTSIFYFDALIDLFYSNF